MQARRRIRTSDYSPVAGCSLEDRHAHESIDCLTLDPLYVVPGLAGARGAAAGTSVTTFTATA